MPEFEITSPQGNKYKVTAPEGVTNEQVLERVRGHEEQSSSMPKAFSDVPAEMARSANESADTIREGLFTRKGEQGVLEGTLKTGKAMAEIPLAIPKFLASPLKSLIGHPLADITHAIGSLISPKTAARDNPEEMYRKAAGDVDTAISGLRPGRIGAGLSGIKTVAPVEAKIEEMATKKVLSRLTQDVKAGGPTAKEAMNLINDANTQGKPITLADVGGENLRGLAGNVARQPGESRNLVKQFLESRDEKAASRLSADIDKFVSGGPGMHQAAETLLKARSLASKEPYAATMELKNIWSPRLGEFLEDPVVKTGLRRGYEIERLQSLAEGRPLKATQLGVDVDVDGNVKLIDVPNMRLLDMAKKGMDAMIADERNEITGRLSARGVALDQLRRSYVKTIDDLDTSGTYKAAREAWGGYSSSLDALREGRTLFQKSPAEIASEVNALSPANREFYRLGVADVIRERLAKTGLSGDEGKALIKNPWMRDQLKPIFKTPKDFEDFVNSVTHESMMFKTKQDMLGGSQTASRLAEDTAGEHQLTGGMIKTAQHLGTGSWFSAAKTAWQTYRDLGLKNNPELNEKIAEILFKTPIPGKSPLAQRFIAGAKAPSPLTDSKFITPAAARLGAAVQGSSLEDSR
jgi:hypothetical protein